MTASEETGYAALLMRIRVEIDMIDQQLQRSRDARNACRSRSGSLEPSLDAAQKQSRTEAASSVEASTGGAAAHASSPVAPVAPVAALRKEGLLLHLVKGVFGGEKFVPHFVVVEEGKGILWYRSEAHCRSTPLSPLGHVPFWKATRNSRGSCFRKAAVCWPLILPEDCPKATDPTKTYFAVEYLNDKNTHTKLIFAAASREERGDWVFFITHFIEMFLPPRAESEELQHLPRGAIVPQHISGVIDGEAPGGNIV